MFAPARLAPAARAFNVPEIMSGMLRADLEAADVAFRDDTNRKIDFHTPRHTCTVWLLSHCGVTPAEARELLGVSSLSLVDRCSRSLRVTRTVIGPDLDQMPMTATATMTGTDNITTRIDIAP